MGIETVPEGFHYPFGRADVRKIRNLVETYEVHAALQPGKQPYQGIFVPLGIIVPREHSIFETDPTLSAEIVLADESDHFL